MGCKVSCCFPRHLTASEKLSEKPDEEQKSANHKSAEQDTLDHKSSEDPTTQPEDRDRADHVVEVSAEVLQSLPQTIPQEHEPRKNDIKASPVDSSDLLYQTAFTDLSELGSGDSDGGQKSWTSPYSIRV
uniref:Uncharacterized protein n=1 Tax=Branchiostoma floridae TaxID=7739 RepID=C3ZKM0_BRAFL|eukprot:XP_002590858.1 hypothetical protein BRAFLDRAFT_108788 [Branchiostoma floridae]